MSAQTASSTQKEKKFIENKPLAVSFRWLLGLYMIVPLCLLLQLLDYFLGHGYLQQHLPSSPKQFLLFQLIFGTPHIIASSILLVTNADYLNHYKHKIIWMTVAIIMIFGVGSLFIPRKLLYVIVAAWTVYHVLKQQFGVGRSLYRLSNWMFYLLLWLSVSTGLLVYLGIFLKNILNIEQLYWIKLIAGSLALGLVMTAAACVRYRLDFLGQSFLWSNVLMVVGSFYLFIQQYYFLAILGPRLVHDMTAYIFYVVHDYNKHQHKPQNFLYRYARQYRLPIFLVLPLLSIVLTFLLQTYGDRAIALLTDWVFGVQIHQVISLGLLGYLALMHYYTEAFTWKQDSPYRRFIAFSK